MKREIKFRFWRDGRMQSAHQLNAYVNSGNNFQGDGEELMQFTGLHDKNGKEIYEGDILHRGLNVCWVVVFKESRWIADSIIDSGLYIDYTEFNTCSIEGNIYENPELLTH